MTQEPRKQNPVKTIISAPAGFIIGATYPLRALAVFYQNPSLLTYLIMPLLINIILGIVLYINLLRPGLAGIDQLMITLDSQITQWISNLPNWLGFLAFIDNILGGILQTLIVIALLVVVGFILIQFGVILGSPFYGQLSEQLEKQRVGELPTPEPLSVINILRDIGRAILFELKKLVLLFGVLILLLPLNLIPVIGSILATVGSFLLMGTIACLDFLDAPLERRRLKFRQKLNIIQKNLPASASFGLICFILASIPLCNLIAIPICVTAGTLFFCDRIWSEAWHPLPKTAIQADTEMS